MWHSGGVLAGRVSDPEFDPHPPEGWHDFGKHISISFPQDTGLEGEMISKFVTYILHLKFHFWIQYRPHLLLSR